MILILLISTIRFIYHIHLFCLLGLIVIETIPGPKNKDGSSHDTNETIIV